MKICNTRIDLPKIALLEKNTLPVPPLLPQWMAWALPKIAGSLLERQTLEGISCDKIQRSRSGAPQTIAWHLWSHGC